MGSVRINGVLETLEPDTPPLPILYSIPHAGRDYPDDFGSFRNLDVLRRAEDAYVDRLLCDAPDQGISVLKALFPRSYLDVNRTEDDLDSGLFVPGTIPSPGIKSALGIGLIRRVITPEYPIYDRFLSLTEVENRIERYYRPYHEAMARLLRSLSARSSAVLFVDWHSMKSIGNAATPDGEGVRRPDIVLGDAHGQSCDPVLTETVAAWFSRMGYDVSVNNPYAGGATVLRYGDPKAGVHGLQIEINRALYLDEASVTLTGGAETLKADLAGLGPVLSGWLRGSTV